MAHKQAIIVAAAHGAFLATGYSVASVNHIAADAGVSIKTLYRHFSSKEDLFDAVIQSACSDARAAGQSQADDTDPDWYALAPATALREAGAAYLHHVLSPDQLGLYRVVIADAWRIPDLGTRYAEATLRVAETLFVGYVDVWADKAGWKITDKRQAARLFCGLLRMQIFEVTLFGMATPSADEIASCAERAAQRMLTLLEQGDC